ncbi:tetratricopeptide repeat protein [Archangium primigenium]|uniref:tetratricopeptide repeat protein n=1 Tax=[Archangium] primigenium TaxID=2792470 RepID=UPI0019564CF3|nr:tetratricopeptide repeat protein [Archangium primigenium]MBM7118309.1 tetratricopeptide repeat protein [Archangium primigenium]
MAKSLVERYEQLLAQDPASAVFVELAKALIAKGEYARVISVCEQGIVHHPQSVTGRVLWGKALILMGRPAEAMAQFDQAVAIDKENPHAYNLISEVLLQRGLYRSALPILRKALALQPNDARVRGWMEQAQAALAGGPAPAFGDLNTLETPAPEEAPAEAAAEPRAEAAAEPSAEAAATPPPAPVEAPVEASAPDEDAPREQDALEEVGAPEPVLASEDEAREAESAEVALPFDDEELPVNAVTAEEPNPLLAELPPPLEAAPSEPEAAPAEASEASADADSGSEPEELHPARPDLLAGLPAVVAPPARVAAPVAAQASPTPVPDVASQAAAYERELRATLLPKDSASAFSRRAMKVLAGVGVGVMLLGGALIVRVRQGGEALVSTLDRTQQLLLKDTESSRQDALGLLSHVVALEEDNTRGWALTAYAQALRYDARGEPEARTRALAALEHPGVRQAHPGLRLASELLVAEAAGRDAASQALLNASATEGAEVQGLAGEWLLARGRKREALERFTRALKHSPRDVRSLVALGGYYRDAEDPVNALRLFSSAAKLAPEHPGARLGLAESRWMMGQELDQALADARALASDKLAPVAVRERARLVQGRLMTALGSAREARALLAEPGTGPLAFSLLVARGEAELASGDMPAAQRSFEQALAVEPGDTTAKAGLGRALLGQSRPKDVLSRVDGDTSPVALVRAAAYTRLGDWKRARVELGHTRGGAGYPAEAIVYLARADVAEGERARAREALEKTLVGARKDKSLVRTALGVWYWQDKSLDKASALLETAISEDSRNDEAASALGQLRLAQGLPDVAIKPLAQAVERNGSNAEAREALGRTLLSLGRGAEGLEQFEAWRTAHPEAGAAHKGAALALVHAGRTKDAEAASARAVKLSAADPEAFRVRAEILFALGDVKGGFGALENANKLDSKSPDTFCAIALAFLRQGLVANADKAFEAARREGPEAPCGQVGAHWVKDSGGRDAATRLTGITQTAPYPWDKSFAQAALARVLLATGSAKQAREAADEAIRLEPFSGRAQLALGEVALKQHDEPAALQAFSRAVELEPADGLAWLALGDALAPRPADTARALQAYAQFLKLAAGSPEAGRVKKAVAALQRKSGGR